MVRKTSSQLGTREQASLPHPADAILDRLIVAESYSPADRAFQGKAMQDVWALDKMFISPLLYEPTLVFGKADQAISFGQFQPYEDEYFRKDPLHDFRSQEGSGHLLGIYLYLAWLLAQKTVVGRLPEDRSPALRQLLESLRESRSLADIVTPSFQDWLQGFTAAWRDHGDIHASAESSHTPIPYQVLGCGKRLSAILVQEIFRLVKEDPAYLNNVAKLAGAIKARYENDSEKRFLRTVLRSAGFRKVVAKQLGISKSQASETDLLKTLLEIELKQVRDTLAQQRGTLTNESLDGYRQEAARRALFAVSEANRIGWKEIIVFPTIAGGTLTGIAIGLFTDKAIAEQHQPLGIGFMVDKWQILHRLASAAAGLRLGKISCHRGPTTTQRRDLDRETVRKAVNEAAGNRKRAAMKLGIGVATLYRLLASIYNADPDFYRTILGSRRETFTRRPR